MVTIQVVLDCEATCGPSVCGIYFNTNRITFYLEVLPRAISKIRKIRVKETRIELPSTCRFYPARLVRLERFVLKETTHTAVPHVDSLSVATRVEPRNVKNAPE